VLPRCRATLRGRLTACTRSATSSAWSTSHRARQHSTCHVGATDGAGHHPTGQPGRVHPLSAHRVDNTEAETAWSPGPKASHCRGSGSASSSGHFRLEPVAAPHGNCPHTGATLFTVPLAPPRKSRTPVNPRKWRPMFQILRTSIPIEAAAPKVQGRNNGHRVIPHNCSSISLRQLVVNGPAPNSRLLSPTSPPPALVPTPPVRAGHAAMTGVGITKWRHRRRLA
jgi:hypothetical protein